MKRLHLVWLAVVLLAVLLLTGNALADTVDSGTCGTNVNWVLDDAGMLTISGSGTMKDYSNSDSYAAPWKASYATTIKTAVIESGVTSIGNYAFYGCSSLTSIAIRDGVTSIGGSAF